jgi:hypothetical protein
LDSCFIKQKDSPHISVPCSINLVHRKADGLENSFFLSFWNTKPLPEDRFICALQTLNVTYLAFFFMYPTPPKLRSKKDFPLRLVLGKGMTTVGTGDDHDMGEGDDRGEYFGGQGQEGSYSLDMIQEALLNANKGDRLSQYERRVALREMKEIIRDLRSQDSSLTAEQSPKGVQEGGPKNNDLVEKYLQSNEDVDGSLVQLKVLREEMQRLLSSSQQTERAKTEFCRKLSDSWDVVGHFPTDLMEVWIKAGGRKLPSTTQVTKTLSEMSAFWEAMSQLPTAEIKKIQSKKPAQQLLQVTRRLLTDFHLSPTVAEDLVTHWSKNPMMLQSSVQRLSVAVEGYQSLSVNAHSLALTAPDLQNFDEAVKTLSAEKQEEQFANLELWRERLMNLESRARRWELCSGVPLLIPLPETHPLWVEDGSLIRAIQKQLAVLNSKGC